MIRQRTYLALGALGDLCNVLPLFWEESRISGPPLVAVAGKYAPLLDGVSYVKPVVYNGDYGNVRDAIKTLKIPSVFASPVMCHGYLDPSNRKCEDFCREEWRLFGGREMDWGTLPLVFDRRNREREAVHMRDWPTDKPWVLVAGKGHSSPFSRHAELLRFIESELPQYWVVDLNGYLFDKPYDLLGIFERALCLVTVDTFHLHLAHAVPTLPVIALVNDNPWYASPKRHQHVMRIPYSKWERSKQAVLNCIRSVPHRKRSKIFHVWSEYQRDGGSLRRHNMARLSWNRETSIHPATWVEIPLTNADLQRTSIKIHDKDRALPFIRDMIDAASKKAGPQDWLMITNDDIGFIQDITGTIVTSHLDCMYSNRVDFPKIERPPRLVDLETAIPYCGTDTFIMRKRWWNENRSKMPDMVLACEAWDLCLRVLMKESGGVEIPFATYHEQHQSFWSARENRRNAGNLHNLGVAGVFLSKRNLYLSDFR